MENGSEPVGSRQLTPSNLSRVTRSSLETRAIEPRATCSESSTKDATAPPQVLLLPAKVATRPGAKAPKIDTPSRLRRFLSLAVPLQPKLKRKKVSTKPTRSRSI